MVSAWATVNELVLGHVRVDDKSNEITAIPQLLRTIAIAGCIVTIDSMGCQTEIAKLCADLGADYILALKENQPRLYEAVQRLFADLYTSPKGSYTYEYARSFDNTHGRGEIRQCWTIADPEVVPHSHEANRWEKLRCVVRVRRDYWEGKDKKQEDRLFLSSLSGAADPILEAVREHWHIENKLHWVLDVAFREVDCRVRKDYGPQNFTLLRHITLNLLKQEKTSKRSIKGKWLQAAWKTDYLEKVLQGLDSLSPVVQTKDALTLLNSLSDILVQAKNCYNVADYTFFLVKRGGALRKWFICKNQRKNFLEAVNNSSKQDEP